MFGKYAIFGLCLTILSACSLPGNRVDIGNLQTEVTYTPLCDTIPHIPKFGMRVRIPADFNSITWYGRGPYENYPDRKTGSLIGIYNSKLENFIIPYPAPQDNANRCDVRWIALSTQNNNMIKISGLQPLCFRA